MFSLCIFDCGLALSRPGNIVVRDLINANMVKIITCDWTAKGIPGHMSYCSD